MVFKSPEITFSLMVSSQHLWPGRAPHHPFFPAMTSLGKVGNDLMKESTLPNYNIFRKRAYVSITWIRASSLILSHFKTDFPTQNSQHYFFPLLPNSNPFHNPPCHST